MTKPYWRRPGCWLYALIFLVLLLVCGGFWAIENVLPYSAIRPWRHSNGKKPTDFGLKPEEISLKMADSIDLKGWLILPEPPDSAQATVIFIHGIGNNRRSFLRLAAELSKLKIRSLLLDGRAHGESGGTDCTFGFHEKKDVAAMVDYLEKRFGNKQKNGIWGASLGGAVALQALEYDPRLDFGLVESTFSELREVMCDYQERMFFGIRLRSVSDHALDEAGRIARFEPDSVQPGESARRIFQPVLMAHGEADEKISFDYGREIFQNLASKEKEFVAVPGGHHSDLHRVGGQKLDDRMLQFIQNQVARRER